jgi:hypothetical protein
MWDICHRETKVHGTNGPTVPWTKFTTWTKCLLDQKRCCVLVCRAPTLSSFKACGTTLKPIVLSNGKAFTGFNKLVAVRFLLLKSITGVAAGELNFYKKISIASHDSTNRGWCILELCFLRFQL